MKPPKIPVVTVTDDNLIQIKGDDKENSYRNANLILSPEQVPELVRILGHAKEWAQICAVAQAKPEPRPIPNSGVPLDEDGTAV